MWAAGHIIDAPVGPSTPDIGADCLVGAVRLDKMAPRSGDLMASAGPGKGPGVLTGAPPLERFLSFSWLGTRRRGFFEEVSRQLTILYFEL